MRLYPRAWRDRYGDEFLAAFGRGRPRFQETIDIVSGAIDAWLSADVRRTTMGARVAPTERGSMTRAMLCEAKPRGVTIRDGLIGAGVMLAFALALRFAAVSATHTGFPLEGEWVGSLVFPLSFTLSMPFWLMKGQPWKAQAAIVGGTLALLVTIGAFSSGR
jgi:hypothetical protein